MAGDHTAAPPEANPPTAGVLSYAHLDGSKALGTFCDCLTQELRMQTGRRDVTIWMDRDLEAGAPWRRRIEEGLAASTFLIPILTPGFLSSEECREELQAFLAQERRLDRDDLVFPVHYVDCEPFLASNTDERATAIWELLASRQFVDWRSLRNKSQRSEAAREKHAALAGALHKAIARTGSSSPAVASLGRRSGPAPADLAAALDPDPVVSTRGAEALAGKGNEIVAPLLEGLGSTSTPTGIVLKRLLAGFPEEVAGQVLARVEAAGGDWHGASRVTEILGPAQAPFCAERFADLIRRSPEIDAVRLAVESLGCLGSAEHAEVILHLLQSAAASTADYYDKYSFYCAVALARIVAQSPMQAGYAGSVGTGFDALESAIKILAEKGCRTMTQATVRFVLAHCEPHHGERFRTVWTESELELMRDLGVYALGGIGVSWAVPTLLRMGRDEAESPAIRQVALFAAGAIGGPEASAGLADLLPEHGDWAAAALTMCIVDLEDDARFDVLTRRLVVDAGSDRCWFYRAIGVRGGDEHLGLLREAVGGEDAVVRGDAALALARLGGPAESRQLGQAFAGAASAREKVLCELALLVIGDPIPGDPDLTQLRHLLMTESHMYRSLTQRDILDVLRASEHKGTDAIVAAWEPIYAGSTSY